MIRALVRTLWGERVQPGVRPVMWVTVLSATGFAAFWTYVGIWAIDELGATPPQVGVMFLVDALGAALAGYVGGRLSDRVGRRRVIAVAWAGQGLVIMSLALVGDRVLLGLSLVVLAAVVGAPGLAASTAVVADVVAAAEREDAYAATRVVYNVGVMAGPPLAAVLLIGRRWELMFFGVMVLGVAAAVVALLRLPRGSVTSSGDGDGTTRALSHLARDVTYLLLLASTLFGFLVYIGFDVILPIVIVDSFGMAPATWGFIVILNPIVVTLFQRRLTAATRRVSPARKLAVALPLMGLPYLLLLAWQTVPAILVVMLVAVVGEMLWTPTSHALAARLAPERLRGGYMGAFSASSSVAWSIGPLIGLQLREWGGDPAMWMAFAVTSIAAAALGVAACGRSAAADARPSGQP